MPMAEAKVEGCVGTICLDHIEKRNSLSGALSDELIKALDNFNENRARRGLESPVGNKNLVRGPRHR
jgi:enoyl-CoA hydratase/carnithine racemase